MRPPRTTEVPLHSRHPAKDQVRQRNPAGVLDVATVLTPLAATGLAVLMVLAMGYHARRKESMPIAINAVLLILAALVMWGRFGPHAF
ncbi:DoxX-like family protein [Streptomyces mirabilis]|uniref:DoxX-like family protein n=1 Tax=Streptomyces mirabilis TaxID=68239 RepID=A0A1I2Y944_9ACTN|nr:DoxX-like family protein [Streptomyces mirabilis]